MVDIATHERYMKEALEQAQRAYELNEVPIGCVVVDARGEIIARSFNQVETQKTQLAHAEMLAVKEANAQLLDWRLDGCWIYVTLEPCAACLNVLLLARCAGLVYGASSPIFGYSLDKGGVVQLYRRDALKVIPGILAERSSSMMKQFFKEKREEHSG